MEKLTLFAYTPGTSPVHRVDPRVKLLLLTVIGIFLFRAGLTGILISGGFIILSFGMARISLARFLIQLKLCYGLFLFIGVVYLLKGFVSGSMGTELSTARLLILRIIFAVILGHIIISTTTYGKIRDAFVWLLFFLPKRTRFSLALMLSTTIAFVPLLFQQARDTREAQLARCIESSRKPVRKIRVFAAALIIDAAGKSEDISCALESRSLSEKRPCYIPKPDRVTWVYAASGAFAVTAGFLMDALLR